MKRLNIHRVKIRKPVKGARLRLRIKAVDKRLDRRQRSRASVIPVVDDTERTCTNCSTEYVGRVCPQCGQVGTWTRYTWHQAVLNFLDIWGLGNRPVFRTLKELSWRPGYMVRDYLDGHRHFYFPPFKLLAIIVVFLFLTSQLTRESQFSVFETVSQLEMVDSAYHVGESIKMDVNVADQALAGEGVSHEVDEKKGR